MIPFFIFFCLFILLYFFLLLLGNYVVGCVLTFGAGVRCLLFCCVSLARYLLLKVVCWPCRAGKAYRRPRPPTLTPQVCTSHWNYMYYINIVIILPFFCFFYY